MISLAGTRGLPQLCGNRGRRSRLAGRTKLAFSHSTCLQKRRLLMNEPGYATTGQQHRISETAREYEVLLDQWCADSQAIETVDCTHMLWISRHIQSESRTWSLAASLSWMRILQAAMMAGGVLRVGEKCTPFSLEGVPASENTVRRAQSSDST